MHIGAGVWKSIFWLIFKMSEIEIRLVNTILINGCVNLIAVALYGCLFTDKTPAAFANFRLWQSVGFVIPFAYSNFLCTDVKLYILTSMLLLGMTGYVIVEVRHRSSAKRQPSPHFTE